MCLVLISGMNTTAGFGVPGLNSVLSASFTPSTLRANSITATCVMQQKGRHIIKQSADMHVK
jgi:hypothetical protein